MRLGVMSDTHGNIPFMQRAADRMREEFEVEGIVHLGDTFADAKQLKLDGVRLFAVPGVYEAAWGDPAIPHRLIEEFGGVRFLISHTATQDSHDLPGDIDPGCARERYGIDVLLHGHTHRHGAASSEDGLVVVNPGHLKAARDRGAPATFAIIDAQYPRLSVKFYELDGPPIEACSFLLPPK